MGSKLSTKNQKLEKAIQARKMKVAKKWIRKGANPNGYSKKSNYSYLSMAITLREAALVELLLKKGANPNQKSWLPMGRDTIDSRSNNDDEYPIHIAAAHGSIKIMEALLNSEIDINKGLDHKQGTALHQAARFGHSKLAELLLANGADIIGIDSRLNIPLHIAATFGQVKVAEVLLQHGSPIDTLNIRRWTPLHYASSEGALSMARLLLHHGALMTAEDNTGHTPLALAKTEEMIRLFLEHAADLTEDKDPCHTDQMNTEGPPKPTRTFVHLTKARERSQSEAQTLFLNLEGGKESVHVSKSYADFGKWTRLHESNPKEEKATRTIRHCHVRKTKSTPPRKYRTEKIHGSEQSDKVAQTNGIHNRSRSLRQVQSKKISVKKRSYSVRHRKVGQSTKPKLPENNIEIYRPTKGMRSQSTSALKNRGHHTSQTSSITQRSHPQKVMEVSVHPINDKRQHSEKRTNKLNSNPSSLGCLSHSLHNLAAIINDTPESPARDANHNVEPKTRVQRTKSEGQTKNPTKESWIDFQLAKTSLSR